MFAVLEKNSFSKQNKCDFTSRSFLTTTGKKNFYRQKRFFKLMESLFALLGKIVFKDKCMCFLLCDLCLQYWEK